MKEYINTNYLLKKTYGEKVYKLSLSASNTCPNRDGTKGKGGCIFCSLGGSGDFAASSELPIDLQIENAKKVLGKKGIGLKYIAYFQSFTGTYGDLDYLEKVYNSVLEYDDIVGISIATRPDCLGDRAIKMLEGLSKKTNLWVELGLQTTNEVTAEYINRCYSLADYDDAIHKLKALNVHIITHIILGLPGESESDMLNTVKYISDKTDGVKFHLLYVVKNTRLEKEYLSGNFLPMSFEEYADILVKCIKLLPDNVVIHRITGDGAKKELLAPLWSADKKRVLNNINKVLDDNSIRAKSL